MADVFWLGHFSLQGDPLGGLRSLGLKPEWVQEAHLLGDANALPLKTVYHWPEQATPAHRLLHFACQALQSGDLDLVLLANRDQAAVLASPKAVGRWNLLPRANLSARFSFAPELPPGQFLPALAVQLLAAEIDPEQNGCAAALEPADFALAPAFPAIQWLEPAHPGVIAQLNRLCTTLEDRAAALGLLFSPGLATVIERL